MLGTVTYKYQLHEDRPFTLRHAAETWKVTHPAAWERLRRMASAGAVRRVSRGTYSPSDLGDSLRLPDLAEELLSALKTLPNYRMAVTGLDLLTPHLHYLPARYPHMLLLEERAFEDVQRALAHSDYLALPLRDVASVWSAQPPVRVVALKQNANWHGVPAHGRKTTVQRAFLDLLVATRRGHYPFPIEDLHAMWGSFDRSLQDRVVRLGRALQITPFYGTSTNHLDTSNAPLIHIA